MVLILLLLTVFCQGESRQKKDGKKRAHLERKQLASHGFVVMPTGGEVPVGKMREGSRVQRVMALFCRSLSSLLVPLILSALLVTVYMPSFEILMNIETEWSQT